RATKDALGEGLGLFVQQNFRAREVILGKLRTLGVASRLGSWLARPENADRLGENAGDALAGLGEMLRDEDIHAAGEQIVRRRIAATPAAPIAAPGVELAVQGGPHQGLLGTVLRGLTRFLDDNRATLRAQLGRESPWWVPVSVDDVVFEKGLGALQRFLDEVGSDPDHELRRQYDLRLRELADRLRTEPELAARAEALKGDLLTDAAQDADSELRRRLQAGLVSFGNRLCTDPALQAKVDGWLEQVVGYLVDQYRA